MIEPLLSENLVYHTSQLKHVQVQNFCQLFRNVRRGNCAAGVVFEHDHVDVNEAISYIFIVSKNYLHI